MALETLKNVGIIDGFEVVNMDKLRELYPEKFNESGAMDYAWFEKEIRPGKYIYVRHDVNSISFTLQNGPIREVGVNGCQIDTIIKAAMLILEGLNGKVPSERNIIAINKLGEALAQLNYRRKDRVKRNVEGYSLP